MRYLLLLVIATAMQVQGQATHVVQEQREPVRNVVLSDLVHNNLDFLYFAIAQTANLEPAFCMIGKAGGRSDTVRVDMLVPAWIDSSSGSNATYQPSKCDMPGVIGTVHFHPGHGYCKLSPDDIGSAHSLPWPVMAIVCIEKPGGRPKLVVVHELVFNEDWRSLEKMAGIARESGGWRATYRYRKPEAPEERP